MSKIKRLQTIVLAGGKGTRMKSFLPKVMVELDGKPLLDHALGNLIASSVDDSPLVVVGFGREIVQKHLGNMRTCWQWEQKGTGHAVQCCQELLAGKCENILTLYGDMPFVSPATIRKLAQTHIKSEAILTMVTIQVPDYQDWRQSLYSHGRVLRNGNGEVIDVCEITDANSEILCQTEVNPSFFCFQEEWLWPALLKLQTNNALGEIYLTDLVRIAFSEGRTVTTIFGQSRDGVGVNNLEELAIATKIIKEEN
ncbi:MAG: NTP transferase domain-containing protein [bacterium]